MPPSRSDPPGATSSRWRRRPRSGSGDAPPTHWRWGSRPHSIATLPMTIVLRRTRCSRISSRRNPTRPTSVWRRMAKGRHIKRGARGALVAAIAAGIVLLALGGVSFAAYRYDQASADRILPGVTVGGVDVGGMTRGDAVAAVQKAVDEVLAEPLNVRA